MKKMKNVLHFRSLKLDYTGLVSGRNQLTRLTWPLNKTLLSPPLLIRLSFRVAMFSWNHFLWDKVKKHASIYWYKLGKKHWKMMTFLRYVIANSTKNIEKCGRLNNRCKRICENSQKASIHTRQRCGPIEKMPGCTYTSWANFAQFHRASIAPTYMDLFNRSTFLSSVDRCFLRIVTNTLASIGKKSTFFDFFFTIRK